MDMSEAETMRYAKIQNLIHLLQGKGNSVGVDAVLGNDLPAPFQVGRKIAIDGERLTIGKKSYHSYEIKKVTINREGSMAIYDNQGTKICGSLRLNASSDHIELFCVWVRKNNIPVEVISGKGERFLQYLILAIVVMTAVFLKILKLILK